MSRALFLTLLCGVLQFAGPAQARADWLFGPLVGVTFQGSTNVVDLEAGAERNHWNLGGAATWVGAGPIGFEGLFVFTPHFLEAGEQSAVEASRTYALMGNLVLAAPLGWNEYGLRPFVSGGLGMLHLAQQTGLDPRAFPLNRNLLAYNLGGGAIGSLTDHTALRFDLRYFTTLERPEAAGLGFGPVRLSYWTTFVGVVLRY